MYIFKKSIDNSQPRERFNQPYNIIITVQEEYIQVEG